MTEEDYRNYPPVTHPILADIQSLTLVLLTSEVFMRKLQTLPQKMGETEKYAISLTRSVFHRTSTPTTGEKGMFSSGIICWFTIVQENLMWRTNEFDANCTEAKLKLIKWLENRRIFQGSNLSVCLLIFGFVFIINIKKR
eukprot:UN10578